MFGVSLRPVFIFARDTHEVNQFENYEWGRLGTRTTRGTDQRASQSKLRKKGLLLISKKSTLEEYAQE